MPDSSLTCMACVHSWPNDSLDGCYCRRLRIDISWSDVPCDLFDDILNHVNDSNDSFDSDPDYDD